MAPNISRVTRRGERRVNTRGGEGIIDAAQLVGFEDSTPMGKGQGRVRGEARVGERAKHF